MSDLFGVAGADLLERVGLPGVYRGRINSLRRLMDSLEFEIDVFTAIVRARLVPDLGYTAVSTIPGTGARTRQRRPWARLWRGGRRGPGALIRSWRVGPMPS